MAAGRRQLLELIMRAIAVAFLAAGLCVPAFAQPGEHGQGRGHDDAIAVDSPLVGVLFGPDAEAEIRSWFHANPYEPQGLPPGIAMNLERGKALPPGIAKRYLPDELLGRLPAYPGHEILVVDDDVLLVAVATMVIVDVLSDVL
jgi:hypothetical protein